MDKLSSSSFNEHANMNTLNFKLKSDTNIFFDNNFDKTEGLFDDDNQYISALLERQVSIMRRK